MAKKPKPQPIDLSEYEEQAVPFDDVIRKIAKAKPEPKEAKPKKPKK